MEQLLSIIFDADFLFSVIRVTTPILLAAMGAVISNKAGIVNISLEGMMLMSALSGVIASAYTQSAWIGLMAALLTGMAMAGILAYFTLKLKTHIILGGIAMNFLAEGGTIFILFLMTGEKGTSSSLPSMVVPNIDIPIIQNIPIIGEILSGHNLITYLAILSVIGVYYLLNKMPLGMKIRAVGENFHAAESVGINVQKVQATALIMSGFFCGLAGAFLSMGYVSWFSRGMTAGRGWIALAAEAMGMGGTIGTALASLLFGFAEALSNSLQVLNIPAELIMTLPYVFTVVGLLIYAIKETNKKKKEQVGE